VAGLQLEYLYVDLGNITNRFTIPGGAAIPGSTFTTTTSYRVTDHIVRAGLNYKLDWAGPVFARY
jgi:opacity protein-like surface antigen